MTHTSKKCGSVNIPMSPLVQTFRVSVDTTIDDLYCIAAHRFI